MSELTQVPMKIAAGRWVRHTFVRENILGALKTFAWLGPLTLLIWVYAERAQVVQVDNVSVPVDVQGNDADRFVSLDSDRNIVLKLNGPRSRIEALRQRIRPEANKPGVVLNIPTGLLTAGKINDLDAAALISDNDVFKYSGVSVVEARPAQLRVFVDNYDEREFDVQKPSQITNISPPTFVPPKVKVRAPVTYFTAEGTPNVVADLASAKILDKPNTYEVTVPVSSPELANYRGVTYTPPTVKATLEVRAADEEYTIRSLPVRTAPFGPTLVRFEPRWPTVIDNVKVRGPRDAIEQIRTELAKPYAILIVKDSDKPGATIPGTIKIEDLPAGVTVVSAPATLDFTLTEKPPQ